MFRAVPECRGALDPLQDRTSYADHPARPRTLSNALGRVCGVLAAAWCCAAQAQAPLLNPADDPGLMERWLAAAGTALADLGSDAIGDDPLAGPTLGKRISRYVALETSHLAIGMTPSAGGALAMPALPGAETANLGPAALSGLAIWPAGDFSVYARFGLTTSLADPAALDGHRGLAAGSLETLGDELLWGVGIGYEISERWTGRFDFQQVPVLLSPGLGLMPSTSRYDLLSIGLTYDF